MLQMHKSTFMVKKDSKTGLKYMYIVKTIDELTKNHRADVKEKTSAIMPENPDHRQPFGIMRVMPQTYVL
jgi:hypothetical protein